MKLDPRGAAISLGAILGLAFLLCSLVMIASPETAVSWSKAWLHMDLEGRMPAIGMGNAICGSILWAVLGGLLGWLGALLYNGTSTFQSGEGVSSHG